MVTDTSPVTVGWSLTGPTTVIQICQGLLWPSSRRRFCSASELVNISVPRNISSNFGAGISLCYSRGGDFSEGHGGRNSLLLLLWVSGCYVQEFRTWVIHLSWIWGLALTNCVLWYGWLKLLLALLLQSWSLTHNLEHVADFVVNIHTWPTHCYLFVFLKLSLFTKD